MDLTAAARPVQASKIVAPADGDGAVLLRSGDRARVTFEFLYRPEYLVLGARLVFREGRTKGIGKVRCCKDGHGSGL